MILHTETFTHTHMFLHREPKRLHLNFQFTILLQLLTCDLHCVPQGCVWSFKMTILQQFFDLSVWRCKIAIITSVLAVRASFRAEGLRLNFQYRNFTSVFDVRRPIRAKGSLVTPQNRNFTSVFDVQRPFRAKRLQGTPQNRTFTSVFDVQRPFRAKGLQGAPQNRNFTSVFDV